MSSVLLANNFVNATLNKAYREAWLLCHLASDNVNCIIFTRRHFSFNVMYRTRANHSTGIITKCIHRRFMSYIGLF